MYIVNNVQPKEANGFPASLTINLELKVDLALLRKQKRALAGIIEGASVSYEQEEAADGMLHLLSLIQSSILAQGLATEEDIFPPLPQLFSDEPLVVLPCL